MSPNGYRCQDIGQKLGLPVAVVVLGRGAPPTASAAPRPKESIAGRVSAVRTRRRRWALRRRRRRRAQRRRPVLEGNCRPAGRVRLRPSGTAPVRQPPPCCCSFEAVAAAVAAAAVDAAAGGGGGPSGAPRFWQGSRVCWRSCHFSLSFTEFYRTFLWLQFQVHKCLYIRYKHIVYIRSSLNSSLHPIIVVSQAG